jgi:filamentous hemagglutinin family protein
MKHRFESMDLKPWYLSATCVLAPLLFWTLEMEMGGESYAQVSPPITSSGLHTQVTTAPSTAPGKFQYDITGGTRPGGGTNLFHSFGDFSVPTNNVANFANKGPFDLNGNLLADSLPTSNILGRVTGGNISNIFGAIQTQGFGSANLFLINPAGFLFGPNATVNVGGMVVFTSADYLRLADSSRFNAAASPADAVLTASPVAAFGFLGSNPGAITIQGSEFTVTEGTGISLVGGNITLQSGVLDDGITVQATRLSAPGGKIHIASLASSGEISVMNFLPTPGITMGNISLSQGAQLNVSGDSAGTVTIHGGQLMIADANISADTGNVNGASIAIDINVTGDVSIADTRGLPAITARATGTGDAGSLQISADNLNATSSFEPPPGPLTPPFSLIDTHTSGNGKGGDVKITATGDLIGTGLPNNFLFLIDSGTTGLAGGTGGDVTIKAQTIQLTHSSINTGDFVARNLFQDAAGSGGNLSITTDSFELDNSAMSTTSFGARGGDLSLTGKDIQMKNGGLIEASSLEGDAGMTIRADTLVTDSVQFENDTAFGPSTGITFIADVIELRNGSTVRSSTFGDGPAGDIHVTARDHLTLFDDPTSVGSVIRPSGFFSNSLGGLGNLGNAGSIVVTSPRVALIGGARIDTSTQTSGHGGDVTITAANIVSLSGERPNEIPEDLFNLGSIHPSGIFTRTVGGDCIGVCGNAGNISVTTGSMSLDSGAQINSGTSSTGRGGDITIRASDTMSLSGLLSDGTPGGVFSRSIGSELDAGEAGNISIASGQSSTISNGATVSASSTGPGNTGNIQITAGNQFAMTSSTVTTEANQSGGGAIKITTNPDGTVILTDSVISASVLDGTGGGGSVNIDPQFVILENSQIFANSVFGPGGNIFITTNLLLPDSTSLISASSQFGQQGNIVIQSPVSPASGKLIPLGQKPLIVTSLLSQRCAALAGGNISSFTVAGRESLPAEPGSLLSSPLALSMSAPEDGTVREADRMLLDEAPLLSVRKIAPPGFLTQAFAADTSDCQS